MADINPTDTTAAEQDAIRVARFDEASEITAFDAAMAKALEAIQTAGWSAPTGTQSRATFIADSVTLPNLAAAVANLINDLLAKGILTA